MKLKEESMEHKLTFLESVVGLVQQAVDAHNLAEPERRHLPFTDIYKAIEDGVSEVAMWNYRNRENYATVRLYATKEDQINTQFCLLGPQVKDERNGYVTHGSIDLLVQWVMSCLDKARVCLARPVEVAQVDEHTTVLNKPALFSQRTLDHVHALNLGALDIMALNHVDQGETYMFDTVKEGLGRVVALGLVYKHENPHVGDDYKLTKLGRAWLKVTRPKF